MSRCKKLRYKDQVAAMIALASCDAASKFRAPQKARKRTETRVYECPVCRGWHLTSEEAA